MRPSDHASFCACPACMAAAAGPAADASVVTNVTITAVGVGAPSYVEALLADADTYRWNLASGLGTPATITFSFMTQLPAYHSLGEWPGFQPLNEAQKAAVREVLELYSKIAGLTFVEVSDAGAGGQIRLGTANVSAGGFAYYGGNWGPRAGDICISNRYPQNLDPFVGGYGYQVLIHEIGHALGFKHPFETPSLPDAQDSYQYTVMSYDGHPHDTAYNLNGSGGYDTVTVYPRTPQLYDIAAIQYLYGANTTTRSGNDVYAWATEDRFIETIWDGGGNDTIDFSNQIRNATINLHAGTFSSLGPDLYIGVSDSLRQQLEARGDIYGIDNLAIAYGTVIENALGGSGSDLLIGNDVANLLAGGGGADTLQGEAGDDTLIGGLGDDSLDGGSGLDTADFDLPEASYTVTLDGTTVVISGPGTEGSDRLSGVELLHFADHTTATAFTVPPAGEERVGGEGNDWLPGGALADRLKGLGGADTLDGRGGSDAIDAADGADLVIGDAGGDVVQGGSDNDVILGGADDDTLFGDGGDDLVIGDGGADGLFGGSGADTLFGGSGDDSLRGEEGNDLLIGETGRDTLEGGAGDDQLQVDGEDAAADGGEGSDTLILVGGAWTIDLAAANQNAGTGPILSHFERVDGSRADAGVAISAAGLDGDSTIFGGAFADTLTGGNGDDLIVAGGGSDSLAGGAGNDTLVGGSGTDTLSGGTGGDTFYLTSGASFSARITDFVAADDTLLLSASFGLTAVAARAQIQQVGADAVLALGAGSVTLVGVTVASLTVADFAIA